MNKGVSSVYIHIPFCAKICSYCDFPKLLYNEEYVLNYLNALEKEIIEKYQGEEIKTIYIGGGTPSVLSVSYLKKLFNIISRFKLSETLEFTFECNLDDIRVELLEILKTNKINRLSIGIQSFNEEKLTVLDRDSEYKDAKVKMSLCRKLGFNNINIDLIYAVPGEKLFVTKSDLNKIIKLGPEHISTYSLIIEDNTKLKINKTEYISEILDSKMYNVIKNKLKVKYNHYEVSNFAKKGYESIHNLVYWNNEEYYGFGLGAAGYYGGVRYENHKNIKTYCDGSFTNTKDLISKKEVMDYELMLGFRKINGINLLDFENKYNIKFEEVYSINDLIKNKSLIIKENHIFINPKKIYLMNEILTKLI